MDYNEYERHTRHKMCILMALETLLICTFMVWFSFVIVINDWQLLYYHENTPFDGILIPMLSILPIGCTILSIYRKWFYRIYEGLHCLIGILLLFGSGSFAGGFVIFLILSARFCIYLFLIKG